MSNEKVEEPVSSWLVRLWDVQVSGNNLTAVEAGKLSHVAANPSLRQRLHNLRHRRAGVAEPLGAVGYRHLRSPQIAGAGGHGGGAGAFEGTGNKRSWF